MAMDGITIASLVEEFNQRLAGGRIYKIYQPENDEICLVVKNKINDKNETMRLTISADAGLPLMYISNDSKDNPAVAPNFCMLLRKHIGNGRITLITQPNFERIVCFYIEHLDEMGDLCKKKLIVEIMGKHSNIIFADENDTIIDSIKHVSHMVSSVREVLPGRTYEFPPSQDKINPIELEVNYFINHVMKKPLSISKAIYTSYTGISPVIANEIANRASLCGSDSTDGLDMDAKESLYREFVKIMEDIKDGVFAPCIAYDEYEPKEFAAIKLSSYGDFCVETPQKDVRGLKKFEYISEVIKEYYSGRSIVSRIKQRSIDLRKIVANAIERTAKKYDLQLAEMEDTKDREKYKVYGELITAYGYSVPQDAKELTCDNYYTNETVTIPLDPLFTPLENAKRYFAKYNKLKRTYEALVDLTVESKGELDYLLSVQNSLDIATNLDDLKQIKAELVEIGYIRAKGDKKGESKTKKSSPLHYISSDGFDMFVGKNNYQNEELTFRVAQPNDMWFHAKQKPGSHVIVKLGDAEDLPDATYEEAARLAAYYSSDKVSGKIDIDYTRRKNLKKPPKSKPGFVIYHTNYSMTIEPDIHGIKEAN